MTPDWQPISHAPKDGTELVVTDFQSPPEFASWTESDLYTEGGYWRNRDGRRREVPTHFIRLSTSAPKSCNSALTMAEGFVVCSGDIRWRTTPETFAKVTGATICWTAGPSDKRVASLPSGAVIAVLTKRRAAKLWTIRIHGFEIWGRDAMLGTDRYREVTEATRVGIAMRTVERILAQAGAVDFKRP
jgi:hypothetical protein